MRFVPLTVAIAMTGVLAYVFSVENWAGDWVIWVLFVILCFFAITTASERSK